MKLTLTLIFQSGQDANLSRFQGSSSISSAEYFNRQETTYAAGRGMQTPDMEDVKESVRQGVTKVAGRLSNLASGAMSQLQVRNHSHFVLQFLNFLLLRNRHVTMPLKIQIDKGEIP